MTPSHVMPDSHLMSRAQTLFPALIDVLNPVLNNRLPQKAVVSVYGGSGAGKSEIGSLLAYLIRQTGLGTYLLSGDNYPRRIPKDNDHERLLVFRERGIKGLVASGLYTPERNALLRAWQTGGCDADPALCVEHPWMTVYQAGGRDGLAGYLGTPREIDFDEINRVLERFKAGESLLFLKRMGREPLDLWYDATDMTVNAVLIVEWTHGNSEYLKGVDIPVFLGGTPQETLDHRRKRNRDQAVDSPFTSMVLEIEQEQLMRRAPGARLTLSWDGVLVTGQAGTS